MSLYSTSNVTFESSLGIEIRNRLLGQKGVILKMIRFWMLLIAAVERTP